MATKECPKCGAKHNKTGKFCSRSCSNSRIRTEETKDKIRRALKGRKPAHLAKFKEIGSPQREKWLNNLRETWQRKYRDTPFDALGPANKRRRVIEEQKCACAKCGLKKWLGVPITLELEHIDGNRQNNARSNLEAICPNCHSLTKTWRGRNIQSVRKISNHQLLDAIRATGNIHRALKLVGLTPKGRNYARAKRLMEIGAAGTAPASIA